MATYLNPSATASAGPSIKDPDLRGGLRERDRIIGGTHRLLSGGFAQDYTGTLRRWAVRWTGLTNTQWTTVKAYIQGGYQLYWQGPEMSAKVGVIVEEVEQDQVHFSGDTASAPHWNVTLTLREGTLGNAVQYIFGSASITLDAITLAGTGAVPSGLLTSLVSYWKLDEASGTRVDSVTTSGNDLTDNNTVTQAVGKVSNAGQFTRANSEYLSHTSNTSLQTGDIDFTIAAWLYIDSFTGYQTAISKRTEVASREYGLDYATATSRFRFYVTPDGSTFTIVSANNLGAPSLSTWYFVVVWHDSVANTINIQVNNGTVDSVAYSLGVYVGTSPFYIGRIGLADYWDGRIDEAGFWKRVLTSTERTNLYNAGAGVTYPFTGVP